MKPSRKFLLSAVSAALVMSAGAGYTAVRAGWLPGAASAAAQVEAGHIHDQYTCPMHPQVVSDKPGSCPICGMDLVKKAPAAAPAAATTAAEDLGGVTLSPRQRVLANVETTIVGPRSLARTIDASGRITYDERGLQQVSAWIGGRIDRLYVNTTGQTIRKGAPMAAIYSPELVTAQQEHLTARAAFRELRNAPYPEIANASRDLAAASRQRLRLLGVTDAQIRGLEATGRPVVSFPVVAPASGVVIERKVQAGQYVETGTPLFDLADFSRVWVEAELFEGDLGSIRPGQRAEVRVTAFPERVFTGRVDFVLPTLRAETRTTRVRIELANPRGELKPDMYATARIQAPVSPQDRGRHAGADGGPRTLAVPASAVIATGRRHVVYVEAAPNRFVPRSVMVGAKIGGYYPVFKGLEAGDKVATSGGFLLDASAQLSGEALDGEAAGTDGGQAGMRP